MNPQNARFDPESHGAGPTNGFGSALRPANHRDQECFRWSKIPYAFRDTNEGRKCIPPPRSGAASAVLKDKLYIFGGFGGGTGRLDDFYSFDLTTSIWEEVKAVGDKKPCCRENNGVVISQSSGTIILFGGYDGRRWLNDLWSFDVKTNRWACIQESLDPIDRRVSNGAIAALNFPSVAEGPAIGNDHARNRARDGIVLSKKRPCCRFGYISLIHKNNFILWGGFDGTRWLNDMYIFDFEVSTWYEIQQHGTLPSRRSCPAWATDEKFVYLHGGYDGEERKDDFFRFNLDTYTWTQMPRSACQPSARYFHSCVRYQNMLIMFGGYSGSQRLSDMYTYDVQSNYWTQVDLSKDDAPSGRSSLVAQVYKNNLYIFGGYNGSTVMNDMYKCRLQPICVPRSSLSDDFRRLINDSSTSDVCFLVEGKEVYAHRAILAVRSEYFQAMLFNGHLSESSNGDIPIDIPDMSYHTFAKVLEYLYTDKVGDVSTELGIQLLIASELFLLGRLKAICEDIIRNEINLDNATSVLSASHQYNATGLKEIALEYILQNLSKKSMQDSLNELKTEPDLLVDIIKLTSIQISTPPRRSPNNSQEQEGATRPPAATFVRPENPF